MATLPTKYDLGGPSSYQSGRVYASADTSAIGRGLSAFGGGIANLGEDLQRKAQQNAVAQLPPVDASFKTQMLDYGRQLDTDTDYATVGQRWDQTFQKSLQDNAKLITDPKARQAWIADATRWGVGARDSILNGAAKREQGAQVARIATALDQYQNIYVDPSQNETERAQAQSHIEATIDAAEKAGTIEPATAYAWRKKYKEGSEATFAKLWLDQNKDAVVPSGDPVSDTVSKIIGHESHGNPNAENPGSTASGVGQFLDSTWVATIKAHRPDLAEGKTDAQLLALKSDPKLGREMTQAYVEDNAKYLSDNNLPVTDGTLYLAHFAGPDGARKVLTAPPDTPIADVLGQKVVDANPHLKGKTAAWVRDWASRVMHDAPMAARPPNWNSLSPEDKASWDQMAAQYGRQGQTEQAALAQAQAAQQKENYQLRIATQDPTLTENEILGNSSIDDGDKASLINSLNEKNKDQQSVGELLRSLQDGTVQQAPFDSRVQATVDKAYTALTAADPSSGTTAQAAALTLTKGTGVAPKPYVDGIRLKLASQNPDEIVTAMAQAQQLMQTAPTALSRDGGTEVQKAAADYGHLIGDLGYTPQEAAQRYIKASDPNARKIFTEAELNKQVESIKIGTITSQFGGVMGYFAPGGGFDALQQGVLLADYKELYKQELQDSGDPEIAAGRANQKIKRLYGTTEINGSATLMKYPPENYYPPVNGGFDYLKSQALDAVQKSFGDPGISEDMIRIDPGVHAAERMRNGQPPSYLISIRRKDANGLPYWDMPRNGADFAFDPAKAQNDLMTRNKTTFDTSRANELNARDMETKLKAYRIYADTMGKGINPEQPSGKTYTADDIPETIRVGPGQGAVTTTRTREQRQEIADELNQQSADSRARIAAQADKIQREVGAIGDRNRSIADTVTPASKSIVAPLMGSQREKNLKGKK